MNREEIRGLLQNRQEGLNIEIKNWLGGLKDKKSKAKLAKEIIALANHGGGVILVGFDDSHEHEEIHPEPEEFEAFSQDTIASIVASYIEPQVQCEIQYHILPPSSIKHPAILVPGGHRTPVWAKRACEDINLLNNTLYVRRPGGNSEPPRTQDDWERLIDGYVSRRQSEIMDAMRGVLNPKEPFLVDDQEALEKWHELSYKKWESKVDKFDSEDPRRLQKGHWAFSFRISDFDCPSLTELNNVLMQRMPRYSGWPPFIYLHREGLQPVPDNNVIEAWLGQNTDCHDYHQDYWRVSSDGFGFLLRPMQEDSSDFMSNRFPKPEGPLFDYTIQIYRVTELLKSIDALSRALSSGLSKVDIRIHYYGTKNRKVVTHDLKYVLNTGGVSKLPEIYSSVSTNSTEINSNLEEQVYALLRPVYEQFSFTELSKGVIDSVARDVLSFR